MSAEENKALVRRGWEEVINRRNLDFLAEAHPADALWHEPDQDIQGIEEMKQYLALYFEAFPDFNISVEDVIAEGEISYPGSSYCPYSPECVEGVFSEVRYPQATPKQHQRCDHLVAYRHAVLPVRGIPKRR